MKALTISPGPLSGEVNIQSSKSACHRAMLCAAMAKGTSFVHPVIDSEDMQATIGCIRALGIARITPKDGGLVIEGGLPPVSHAPTLDCGESGSTLRFLLSIALSYVDEAAFVGRGRLLDRPVAPMAEAFAPKGIALTHGKESITLNGRLEAGDYAISGDVSSQFISGLMMALAVQDAPSTIHITTRLESRDYIEMTMQMQHLFGCQSRWIEEEKTIHVPGGGYHARDIRVEGDWSHAAFFLGAGALSGPVFVRGMSLASLHGDKRVVDILRQMGAEVQVTAEDEIIRISRGDELKATDIDAAQIPDLVPLLAVVACGAKGTTRIYNAGRLRGKESDRITAMASGIKNLGGSVEEKAEELIIHGTGSLRGGQCDSFNDHRIAMALAVASCICKEPVVLSGWESVRKSAPGFFDDFTACMGGVIDG